MAVARCRAGRAREQRAEACSEAAALLKHGGDRGLRDVPFPNMAGIRAEEAPHSQPGGNLGQLPALRPRLAIREALAARFPRGNGSAVGTRAGDAGPRLVAWR